MIPLTLHGSNGSGGDLGVSSSSLPLADKQFRVATSTEGATLQNNSFYTTFKTGIRTGYRFVFAVFDRFLAFILLDCTSAPSPFPST